MKGYWFLLIASIFLYDGCVMEKFYGVSLVNNSGNPISVYYTKPNSGEMMYPDTTLSQTKPIFIDIMPNSSRPSYFNQEYHDFFEALPADTLSIFLFDKNTVHNKAWEQIIKEYDVLARYDLSQEDLHKLKYLVTYPPSPQMSGVKVYIAK